MPTSVSLTPLKAQSFLQFSWKPTNFSLQISSKFQAFYLSITSTGSDSQQPFINKLNSSSKRSQLPVLIKRNGKDYRYFYDGKSLKLVCVDDGVASTSLFQGFEDGFWKFIGIVRDFFIPKQVTQNYIDYVKWKFLHRVFSSALQVLATQAMFRAIGVGYAQSLPSAAALNWVLKDGLGRLSRCIYTACVGSAFDTNLKDDLDGFSSSLKNRKKKDVQGYVKSNISKLYNEVDGYSIVGKIREDMSALESKPNVKRVRFATSVMFSLSIGVELMTPAFPNCFLLLASVANIAKQMSLACYLATGTAVHRSFALADNLGEVSAKAQIQTVCFDNLGLLLAASLNVICRNNPRLQAGLPFVVYPIFSVIDLCGIYQALKHVHLQTLTKDRLEIILKRWIQYGYVPSPAEVSKLEGINLFEYTGRKKGLWPIRIGCLDPKRQVSFLSMSTMTSLSAEDYYFICLETHNGLGKSQHLGILLALREGAGTKEIITGLLQACYIREAIHSSGKEWEDIVEASDFSHSVSRQWFTLLQNTKHRADSEQNLLQEQIINASWAAKNVLLSTQEQARFEFVDENS